MPEFDNPEENREVDFTMRPAPAHMVGELINEIHHITPDLTAQEAAAGQHADPDQLSELVPLSDTRYVYDEAPQHPLGVGRVGLTEVQFINDPRALENQAKYDFQMIGGESGAVVHGSVDDLIDGVMRSPDYLPVIRHAERTLEYGGFGGTPHHETLGVAYYYPHHGEPGEGPTILEIGVVDPRDQAFRVGDAQEWTDLVRLKRLDQQLGLSASDEDPGPAEE